MSDFELITLTYTLLQALSITGHSITRFKIVFTFWTFTNILNTFWSSFKTKITNVVFSKRSIFKKFRKIHRKGPVSEFFLIKFTFLSDTS